MSKFLAQMSHAITSGFQPLVPPKQVLRPFQRVGPEYLLAVKRGLLCDDCGLGKSPQSVAFMNTAKVSQYLVVCPASLLNNWKIEIERWSTLDKPVHVFKPGKKNPRDGILILSFGLVSNVDVLKRILANYRFQGLIVDEFHLVKSMDARRTKNLLGIGGPFDRAEFIVALSGTPLVNKPVEIWPVASRINPTALGCKNFKEFGQMFAEEKLNPFTNKIEYVGSKNEKILGELLRSTMMIRRRREDVLHDLPEKTRRAIYLNTNAAIDNLVSHENRMHDDFLANKKLDLDQNFRVRVQLASHKIKPAIEYCKLILSSEEKILVFAYHRQLLTEILIGLSGYGAVALTGATPGHVRQERVGLFQNDPKIRVFVGAIDAAGVGLTLTAASHIVMAEASWVSGANLQCESRAHRMGQKKHVVVDYLVFPGSVDEKILRESGKKQRQIDLVLG